ncbi:hypothetical protein A1O1_03341 [Capronia coronata CBS 617.96]|uniref:AMMECR1 domain-containing protein n=1 Tax=Capronia coronata CBS 617.96 TaxID=1182541 RepID=W9YBK0_9EURO|nr:uncharacterized protein A1O1_03341 [Capronia coronata CBS 617.96]EXJ90242.1 hypothetical protein A1O1_03341 [Capronia coronata CBS 617.96]
MASPAHCFYCFETLAASFKHRDPPTLQKVLDLYEAYKAKALPQDEATEADEEEDVEMESHVAGNDANDNHNEEEDDDEDGAHEEIQRIERRTVGKSALQPPSISRLQARSSSSRSSSTSSPSIFSPSSSNSQLTTPSSATSIKSVPPTYASQVSATESYPLFVTWNTVSRSGHKSLRGCIGTFEALPLASGLSTYALTSAFDDTRFSPIPESLLPALSCSLTLLADFEPCKDAMDWTLGIHGLRISFTYRNRRHGATYLPDVAVEQGWDKEQTVESLMKKAGWDGGYGNGVARRLLRGSARPSEQQSTKPWDEVQDFRAVRYTGLKASASYAEWQDWRQWVEKNGEVLN